MVDDIESTDDRNCASSMYGAPHPPYSNPPSRSSSGEPEALHDPVERHELDQHE